MSTRNKLLAEMLGTFGLVFAGCGAIVVNDFSGGAIGHGGISLVFGLIVMTLIYAVGNISGAHFNPAVTIGFFFAKRFPAAMILPYVGSQLIGGLLAAAFLWWLFPNHETLGATLPSIPVEKAFAVEVLLSFLLMFVILNISTGHMEKGIMAGVAVGGIIALEAMVGGPLTGASMNPARSLAPALVSGELSHIWIYLVAPVIGTVLAHPTCKWIQGTDCCKEENNNE